MESSYPEYQTLPASWRDLGALRQLEKICFPKDAWPLLDLIGVLSLPNVVRLKAVCEDKMVGFVAGDRRSNDLAWIATIGVLPAYRRRGIAAALLRVCESQLNVTRIRLSVRLGNAGAIQLYERFGYQRIDIWPEYYQDGTDALVFEKQVLGNFLDR
jgi:ribosomal protein S18 acetylase RimI-like enzyme